MGNGVLLEEGVGGFDSYFSVFFGGGWGRIATTRGSRGRWFLKDLCVVGCRRRIACRESPPPLQPLLLRSGTLLDAPLAEGRCDSSSRGGWWSRGAAGAQHPRVPSPPLHLIENGARMPLDGCL